MLERKPKPKPTKLLNAQIDVEILKKFKMEVIRKNTTMTKVLSDLIKKYIS